MRALSLIYIIAVFILAACSPEPVTFEVTRVIAQVTQVEITSVVEVTRLVELTRVVEQVVTQTPTPTPENGSSPSNTLTPSPSPTPAITPNPAQVTTVEASDMLSAPKTDGIFSVGVDILPGK